MFFFFSQVFSWLLLPFSQILVALTLAILLRNPRWKRIARYTFIALLLWYSSPLTSSLALRWWEVPATPINEINQDYDVGIVLGGMANLRAVPADRPHFSHSVDRITDAIILYKKGIIKRILISGGSGYMLHPDLKESMRLKDFCLTMGVKEADIFLENESRNTYQNAQNSMRMIEQNWPGGKYLLITSASHMRRSLACFEKAGGKPAVFSTDINTVPFDWDFRQLIPSLHAIATWSTVFREVSGYTIYWLVGYL